jgi:hypothetical protein
MTSAAHGMTVVNRSNLGNLDLLQAGGQGKVYRSSKTPLLYKEYLHPETVRADRLAALVHTLAGMSVQDQVRVERLTAFPQQLVYEGSELRGFLMAEAPSGFRTSVGTKDKLLEIQYLTHPKKAAWKNLHIPDEQWKLQYLAGCARLFETLHSYSLIVGDVSMRNLLWSASATPNLFLIDCDSMRLVGEEPAVPAAFTPDWEDPADPRGTSIDADCYKLSLMILRVLTVIPAIRPEDPGLVAAIESLPERPKTLLTTAAKAPPGQRAIASRWVEALENRGRIQLAPLVVNPARPSRISPAVRPVIPVRSGRV